MKGGERRWRKRLRGGRGSAFFTMRTNAYLTVLCHKRLRVDVPEERISCSVPIQTDLAKQPGCSNDADFNVLGRFAQRDTQYDAQCNYLEVSIKCECRLIFDESISFSFANEITTPLTGGKSWVCSPDKRGEIYVSN